MLAGIKVCILRLRAAEGSPNSTGVIREILCTLIIHENCTNRCFYAIMNQTSSMYFRREGAV